MSNWNCITLKTSRSEQYRSRIELLPVFVIQLIFFYYYQYYCHLYNLLNTGVVDLLPSFVVWRLWCNTSLERDVQCEGHCLFSCICFGFFDKFIEKELWRSQMHTLFLLVIWMNMILTWKFYSDADMRRNETYTAILQLRAALSLYSGLLAFAIPQSIRSLSRSMVSWSYANSWQTFMFHILAFIFHCGSTLKSYRSNINTA